VGLFIVYTKKMILNDYFIVDFLFCVLNRFLKELSRLGKYVIKKCLNSAVKKIEKNKAKKGVFVEKKLNL
jgi:hypothetical protein